MWSNLASLSIDHIQSFEYEGRTSITRVWGTYLCTRPYANWSTGKYYLEAPGLYGAVDPLMQGSNLYVKMEGTDLVASYLGYEGWFLVIENDLKDFHYLGEAIAEGDFRCRLGAKYVDTGVRSYHGWYLEQAKWPDWKKFE